MSSILIYLEQTVIILQKTPVYPQDSAIKDPQSLANGEDPGHLEEDHSRHGDELEHSQCFLGDGLPKCRVNASDGLPKRRVDASEKGPRHCEEKEQSRRDLEDGQPLRHVMVKDEDPRFLNNEQS